MDELSKSSEFKFLREADPLVYFDQCGWDGFLWGGKKRVHFRFSDSDITGIYSLVHLLDDLSICRIVHLII